MPTCLNTLSTFTHTQTPSMPKAVNHVPSTFKHWCPNQQTQNQWCQYNNKYPMTLIPCVQSPCASLFWRMHAGFASTSTRAFFTQSRSAQVSAQNASSKIVGCEVGRGTMLHARTMWNHAAPTFVKSEIYWFGMRFGPEWPCAKQKPGTIILLRMHI